MSKNALQSIRKNTLETRDKRDSAYQSCKGKQQAQPAARNAPANSRGGCKRSFLNNPTTMIQFIINHRLHQQQHHDRFIIDSSSIIIPSWNFPKSRNPKIWKKKCKGIASRSKYLIPLRKRIVMPNALWSFCYNYLLLKIPFLNKNYYKINEKLKNGKK